MIASDVDDRDPTGELMRPFRNYRHHAWRQLMSIHRGRGETFVAIGDLFRARSAYVTHCATCEMEAGFAHSLADISLAVLHGEARDELEEAALERDVALVHAALDGQAEPVAFLRALAETLRAAGRAEVATRVAKLIPPSKDRNDDGGR